MQTAAAKRGGILSSVVPHIEAHLEEGANSVENISDEDFEVIRKKLKPPLLTIAMSLANRVLAPQEIATNAIAVAALSNRTPFVINGIRTFPFHNRIEAIGHDVDPHWEGAALSNARASVQALPPYTLQTLQYPDQKERSRER